MPTATKTRPGKRQYTEAEREEFAAKAADKRARMDQLITDGLETLTDPATWRGLIARMRSNVGRYSFRNQLLVAMQAPGATDVRGYGDWQAGGRQVRKGEAGIMIMAPRTVAVPVDSAGKEIKGKAPEDAETRRKMAGVKIATVFDITQTDAIEGKPQKPLSGWEAKSLDALRAEITEAAGDHAEAILEALDAAERGEDLEEEDLEAAS